MTSFAIGDVDGDGNLDIITSVGNPPPQTGFSLLVLYGNGDGTFQNPVSVAIPHFAASIASGDLNQDGIADLVFSDGNVVTVIHGAHDRTFGPPRDYLAGDSPIDPILVDLNGDGALDLVFANSETNNVSTATVLLNLGVTRGALTATPNPSVYGQPIALSASFVGTVAAAGQPTGSVSFSVDNAPAGVASLQNGTASFNDTLLTPPGTHSVAANWGGDDTFNPHNLSGQVVVNKADTSIILSSAPSVVVTGQTVSVTVHVVPPFQGVPTGTIRFQASSGSPSSATLDSAASASLAVDTSKLALGAYSYTASYSGDANFNPSTSTGAQFKVTDFVLAVDPGSLTVTAGGSGNVNVSASSASGFNGTVVDLSCSGLPSNRTAVSLHFDFPRIRDISIQHADGNDDEFSDAPAAAAATAGSAWTLLAPDCRAFVGGVGLRFRCSVCYTPAICSPSTNLGSSSIPRIDRLRFRGLWWGQQWRRWNSQHRHVYGTSGSHSAWQGPAASCSATINLMIQR